MTCKGCHSDRQRVFNGELAIHFRGLEGLDKAMVWVFPKLVVCLHCGLTEFTVPERELQVLVQGSPVKGAVVWDEKVDRETPNGRVPFTGMNVESVSAASNETYLPSSIAAPISTPYACSLGRRLSRCNSVATTIAAFPALRAAPMNSVRSSRKLRSSE